MATAPEEIRPDTEQKKQIAALAEKTNRSWEEVLQAALDDYLRVQGVFAQKPEAKPRRKAGSAQGKTWKAPDFDAPLEEFKDYM